METTKKKQSSGQPKGIWREIYDYNLDKFKDLYPKKVLNTVWLYISNQKLFFDDVFARKYDTIVPPLKFFLICMLFTFSGFYNHEKLNKSPDETATLDVVLDSLDKNEAATLLTTLNVDPAVDTTDEQIYQQIKLTIKDSTDRADVTPDQVITFLNKNNNKGLAARMELIFEKIEKEKTAKDPPEWVMSIVTLLYFIPFWLISHRFIGCKTRTPTETCYVYMYGLAIFYGLFGIGLWLEKIAGMGTEYTHYPLVNNYTIGIATMIAFPAVIIIFIKQNSAFKYTHGAGFGRMMWAGFLTNLVVVFGILVLALIAFGIGAIVS